MKIIHRKKVSFFTLMQKHLIMLCSFNILHRCFDESKLIYYCYSYRYWTISNFKDYLANLLNFHNHLNFIVFLYFNVLFFTIINATKNWVFSQINVKLNFAILFDFLSLNSISYYLNRLYYRIPIIKQFNLKKMKKTHHSLWFQMYFFTYFLCESV